MEESESRYKTREDFVSELAFTLTNHDIWEAQYLDVTNPVGHPARGLQLGQAMAC